MAIHPGGLDAFAMQVLRKRGEIPGAAAYAPVEPVLIFVPNQSKGHIAQTRRLALLRVRIPGCPKASEPGRVPFTADTPVRCAPWIMSGSGRGAR